MKKRLLCLFFCFFFICKMFAVDGNRFYEKGLDEKRFHEKQQAFNLALKTYFEEEKQVSGYSLGNLHYNIGNTFYHLSEYPMALLYFYKASLNIPRNVLVKEHIRKVEEKLGVINNKSISFFVSLQEVYFLFFLSSILSTGFCAFYLINRSFLMKKLFACFLGASFLFMVIAFFMNHLAPLYALVIKPAKVYLSQDVATFPIETLTPGKIVRVIDVRQDGKLLRVRLENGKVGFITFKKVRII